MAGSSLRAPVAAAGALRSATPRPQQRSPVNSAAAAPPAVPAAPAASTGARLLKLQQAISKSPSDLRRRGSPAWGGAVQHTPGGEEEEQQQQQPSSPFVSSSTHQQQQGGCSWLSRAVNVSFWILASLILLAAIAAAGKSWLPQHHRLRSYADQLLKHAPRVGASSLFRLTPVLQRAAATAAKDGHKAIAEWLYAVADHPLTDALFLVLFSLCSVFFVFFFLRGLRAYKRERDMETGPPETMYCTNRMTAEEFANREATYKAIANLMKDPEYLKMKGTRAAAGPAAWNWQLRARDNPSELLQEELEATSGEE